MAPGEVPLVDTNLAIASAALAVARGDEGEAADALRDYLDGAPVLGMGHAAAPQQRSLAHWYVLVPESRPTWDAAPLGPSLTQARSPSSRRPTSCVRSCPARGRPSWRWGRSPPTARTAGG